MKRPHPDAARITEEARARNGHNPGGIVGVRADAVKIEPVTWFWRGRIPKGKLTIFDGDPDVGKSAITTDIAARKSAGRAFPDGAPCEPGNVIIANVEDGAGDTIVPRLKAAGADLTRVHIISGIPDGNGGTRLLELPMDIALLEAYVRECEAALLILDPIMTMLGGDANKDQDARKALTPVRDMAERTDAAVIAVRHLNKSVGLKAIQRGGGNMGLIGVARAGSFFAEHPERDGARVMAPHKSNLAEKPPSLAYRIVSSPVHNTARVEWLGTTEHDANALAANAETPHEKSVLDDAKDFLREELAAGPIWAAQIFKDARKAGVAEITLRRAKSALSVKSERHGEQGWAWRLPGDPSGGGEDDHAEEHPDEGLGDRDDQDEHVDHLPGKNGAPYQKTPYLREDDHGDQDDHGDHGGEGDHDHDHLPPDPLAAYLANPPKDLIRQAEKCAREGGAASRLFEPLVSSVAYGVYQTAAGRCDEVRPLVEAWVRGVDA